MELGHLAPKSEDLLDNRKLCRLFGACISKLESRHNGGKNLLAAVRKVCFKTNYPQFGTFLNSLTIAADQEAKIQGSC